MNENLKYKFFHALRVRYAETDAQSRVFFGNYLNFFDVALTEYLRSFNYSYQEMTDLGMDIFYISASCQYKGAARFDDMLHVHARVGKIGNTSFTFEFAIFKQPSDELITTGQITVVAVDMKTEKPIRVPDQLREAVARYEGLPSVELKDDR